MKAAVVPRYGSPDVIRVCDIAKPEPGADDVLIRVRATTVNRTDCGELRAHPIFMRLFYGFRRPRRMILGFDVAGDVEAVGRDVTAFKPGDRVFGMCPTRRPGAQADYVCIAETGPIAHMPAGLGFADAVVCEGAYYADASMRRANPQPGRKIMVYGASGAIGTAAVQLAKFYGAEVTAVVATKHLELAKSLGADRVIDYTASDFTKIGERFDFLFDAVGKLSFTRCRKLLKPDGVFGSTDMGPWGSTLLLVLWSALTRSGRVVVHLPRVSARAFVEFMRDRLAAGQFRAVIDRTYPLDAIADAYRYVETGQKTGIVVIAAPAADENTR